MSRKTKNTQNLAAISLTVMAAGFVGTMSIQNSFWGGILQGGFESGLVGGLADWFAVTALFRHPLGIPIPHTALLPKNRNKIIKKIVSMLENDWLTKDSIKQKINTIQFTEVILPMIEKEKNNEAIKKTSIDFIQKIIHFIDIHQLAVLIEKELKTQLNSIDARSLLPTAVKQIAEQKYDERALDYILTEVELWANQDSTKNRLGSMAVEAIENIKADGFMQFALKSFSSLVNEEKLGNIIQTLILKGVNSFRNPSNQNRLTLLRNIHKKLDKISTDEKLIEELNQWKVKLIKEWNPEKKILDILNKLQQKAINFIGEPAFFDTYILPFMTKSFNNFKQDTVKIKQIENWIQHQAFQLIEKNHSKIGNLVEENLKKLDDNTLIVMLEQNVGKDLQWIRVNGAICGFLIGLVLVGIKAIF